MAWTPSSIVIEDWARLRLVINNKDVTYDRGVPFVLGSYTINEPFGDATLQVAFPQYSSLEALPTWLVDNADVTLYGVPPVGDQITLWQGLWVSEDSALSENDDGLNLDCVGANYQVDFYRKAPELRRYKNGENDIAQLIAQEFDWNKRPALRTAPLITPSNHTGITWAQKGAWDQALSGYVQSLLAIATSSGLPQPGEQIVGIQGSAGNTGYWLVGSMGSVLPFGSAPYYGSMTGTNLNEAMQAIAPHPNGGYWLAARDGGVFTFGYDVGFYGSMGATPTAYDTMSIASRPQGDGYWITSLDGGVFAFGAAAYHGNPVGTLVAGDAVIAIESTASGNGYWLCTQYGYVYAYGDAAYHGGTDSSARRIINMAVRPDGGGYWLLDISGAIYNFGTAAAFGPAPITVYGAGICSTSTGAGVWVCDYIGGVFNYGDAGFYGSVPGGGGRNSQWTISLESNRQPKLKVKDTLTVKWHVTCGDQGVTHSLSRDTLMTPNVRYGEGVDPDGCIWRNTRYPNYNATTAPVFSGTDLTVGTVHADVYIWAQHMQDLGWRIPGTPGTTFTRDYANVARAFQQARGLAYTGIVNAQTWSASFEEGSTVGDLTGAYFAPLASESRVEAWLYGPRGEQAIANPAFDRSVARIEGYDNYGAQVTKWEGQTSAQATLDRDWPATYAGTITLSIDPEEGSRFVIRAGDNIVYRYFRGVSTQFHIAGVDCDWTSGAVTLHVDTLARDMLTLAALRQRVRDQAAPTNRPTSRRSQQVEDRKVVWDCESGAGIIPYQAITPGLWQVNRVPAGEFGDILETDFTCEYPSRMAIAVCNKEVTPAAILANIGTYPDDAGFWTHPLAVAAWDEMGLVMGWGGEGQMGGFYPGTEGNGDAATGVMLDDQSWHFEAISPPWLWVAMWVESGSTGIGTGSQYIRGRLKPGALT